MSRIRLNRGGPFPVAALLIAVILFSAAPFAGADSGRKALVIGNSAYPTAPLANPENDARDMASTLTSLGFETTLLVNGAQGVMLASIDEFAASLQAGDTALFYFAGHGIQIDGVNYLIPIDLAPQMPDDVKAKGIAVDGILGRVSAAHLKSAFLILDACRDNPFTRTTRSLSRGLTIQKTQLSTMVVFSTGPGQVASDGSGRNGLFTETLLKYIRTQGLEINSLLNQVRRDVASATNELQVPFVSSSLTENFYFTPTADQSKKELAASADAFILSIQTKTAGMDVSIDGLQIGVSPLSVSLPPGAHIIGLSHPDFDPSNQRIEGVGGAVVLYAPDLQPNRAARRATLLAEETQASLEVALAHKNIGDAKIRGARALGNTIYWGGIGAVFVYIGGMFQQDTVPRAVFQDEGWAMLGIGGLIGILGVIQFAVIPSMPEPKTDRLTDIEAQLKALDASP